MRAPVATTVVLLGAGHAHVEVIRRFGQRPPPGVRTVLVTPERHAAYSGLLPALIRRECSFADAHIDCAALAGRTGTHLALGSAVAIDPVAARVLLSDGALVAYDLLSIDIGGLPAMPPSAGIAVKPVAGLLQRLARLDDAGDGATLAVVGGGAGGTELALALAWRFRGRRRIALVCRGAGPVPAMPARGRRAVLQRLADLGVVLHCGVAAVGHHAGTLHLSDGRMVAAEAAFWATGVRAPALLACSGLACDPLGCVQVDAALRSLSHARVFAAGDCAAIDGAARPKSGVWAVRAGPPLAANLRRTLAGQPALPWQPQREALAILGLGAGRAVAWRNGVAVAGRLPMWWKDRIDRGWMRRFPPFAPT